MRRWATAIVLGALVLVSLGTTTFVHRELFPSGSPNLDEVAYEAQARAYAQGELTLPAERVLPDFRPYLSGLNDSGDVVFKYQPLWPALLAASLLATGGMLAAQLVVAGATVLATAWFCWELLRSIRAAVIAAGIVACSPIAWLLSGTVLGYQLSFALVAAAAAASLRTERVRTSAAAALAGLAVGAAFLHRPFDSLIALAPVLVMVAWRARNDPAADRRRLVGGFVLGGLPFAVAFGAVNTVVMGAPWRVPFNASGDLDRFGFGWRASFEVSGVNSRDGQVDFTPGLSFRAQRTSIAALFSVVAGGPFLAALAGYRSLVGLFRRDRRAALLVAMFVSVVAGYFFWWGAANLIQFELHRALGPVYHEPLLLPLAVAAAWAIDDFLTERWGRRAVVGLGLVMAGVLTVVLAWPVLERANRDGQLRADEAASVRGPEPSLGLQTPLFPGDPYVRFANEPDLSGDHLVALDDPARRVEVAFRFPDRSLVVLEDRKPLDDLFGVSRSERLEPRRIESPDVAFTVERLSDASPASTWVAIGDRVVPLGDSGTLLVRAAELPDGAVTTVTVFLADSPELARAPFRLEWTVQRTGGLLRTLDEPRPLQHYDFGEGRTATVTTDLSAVVSGRAGTGT